MEAEAAAKEKRLEEIEAGIEDINEKLKDLQKEYFKGKLGGPEADKIGRPLRKLRKKLRGEKKTLLGVTRLGDEDEYSDPEDE